MMISRVASFLDPWDPRTLDPLDLIIYEASLVVKSEAPPFSPSRSRARKTPPTPFQRRGSLKGRGK
jgi:hypothetical protein